MHQIEDINVKFLSRGWIINKALNEFDDNYLSEDLAQYYKEGIVIDFGFYGDGTNERDGEFAIHIIKNSDWENYIAKFNFKSRVLALSTLEYLAKIDFDLYN